MQAHREHRECGNWRARHGQLAGESELLFIIVNIYLADPAGALEVSN